jgi:hypothetical protein
VYTRFGVAVSSRLPPNKLAMSSGTEQEQTGLYEPLLPPFRELSATSRGPAALVVATTFFIITTITVVIKVYTMYATTRKLGWNDGMMVAALVSAVLFFVWH